MAKAVGMDLAKFMLSFTLEQIHSVVAYIAGTQDVNLEWGAPFS